MKSTRDHSRVTNYEFDTDILFGKYSGKRVSELPEYYLKYLLTIDISANLRVNVEDFLEGNIVTGNIKSENIKITPLEGKLENRRCYIIAESRQALEAFLEDNNLTPHYYFDDDLDKGRASISESDRSVAIAAGAVGCSWTDMGDGKEQIAKTKENNNKTEGSTMVANIAAPKNISFDTETEKVTYFKPLPDIMCMTFADAGSTHGSLVTPWEQPVDKIIMDWWNQGHHTIGQNVSYDLGVLAFNYPHMLPHIFDALEKGLIHDTMLREKLINITMHGSIEFIEVNGVTKRCGYAQDDMERHYLNIDRSDLKKSEDAPRTNYHIYRDVPAAQWSAPFVDYAVDDATNCGLIFMKQEEVRKRCIDETGYDPFATEYYKMKSAWALRLLECAGTRQDPERIIEVTKEFEAEYLSPRLVVPLEAAGFRTPPIPPQPYKNGALDHSDICKSNNDPEHLARKKRKECGCPIKMKNAEPEHSPIKPRHQHIWNLAGCNENIEAWPSDACVIALKKEGLYKTVIDGKKFKQSIIQSQTIERALANIDTEVSNLSKSPCPPAKLKKLQERRAFIHDCQAKGHKYYLPDDMKLSTAEEWAVTFTSRNELLETWYERERLKKIVNEYLPKMWYEDEEGNRTPATILRASYGPLVLTGRSHSWASKWYPSRSDQTVDPRVRPCTIPHKDGDVIVSTDYNGMELGTLAQICINLFGASELANKINAGIDTHAYLGAQIAFNLDTTFQAICNNGGAKSKDDIFEGFWQTKESGLKCTSEAFINIYKTDYLKKKRKELDRDVTWGDFFKHYRTMAKPVGLGYPGMLGAATLCSVAKATYGVIMDTAMAENLKGIWLETYPEMKLYLDYIKKQSKDPHHAPIVEEDDEGKSKTRTYYCYDTPRGMHRAKCGICEAANGTALQAPSAEGALDGLYEVQKACWLAEEGDPIYGYMPTMFIHDEIVGECANDDKLSIRVGEVERIMVECMEKITPDVKAGAESAAMFRWNKYADRVVDDAGNLVPWIPDPEKGVA